ncbi:MAG: DUF1800 family protein [Hyphomicrobiales bacterium]|nr:DUF1800 family protein [Hyphomicrobiales bacterium]
MSAANLDWYLVYNRFGFGARLDPPAHNGDPRDALLSELASPGGARLDDAELPESPKILQAVYADQLRRKMERDRTDAAQSTTFGMPAPNVAPLLEAERQAAATPPANPTPPPAQAFFRADAAARLKQACAAPVGYVERLTAFWSNHFCVSVAKSEIGRAAAGAFEREAIRPHVLGRFADMLAAVEHHPVMLNFLDNAQSVGPDSKAGQRRQAGLNENLGREILELHTLGVGSGYTQGDVTELARILTGWTIVGREGKLGEPGTFVFNANAHEPGPAKLLGRTYAQEDVAQGEAALADLAREPATAHHVAFKLVRHFVADSPDAALVGRLAEVFRRTDGDLGALARALALDPEAWRAPPTKVRNPWAFTVAVYRAFGRDPNDPGPALGALNQLGMPLWQPAGPNGFTDVGADWASPEGMKTRVELAAQFARQVKNAPKPPELLEQLLGPAASPATREAVARAESQAQAYALLVLSPEFQKG